MITISQVVRAVVLSTTATTPKAVGNATTLSQEKVEDQIKDDHG
jgi:hypothetical protein